MNDPARRLRVRPKVDLNYLHERMEGLEGSVTLHFRRDSGLQKDKIDIRLIESAPEHRQAP